VPERPNIVWISVEDMSPWLGCYGDDTVPTPNVDRLAARGTRYTQAHANAPVCAPARATLITGCYATAIGAMHMRTGKPSSAALAADPQAYDGIPVYEATPPEEVRCFPELLRTAGYYCTNNSKRDYQFKAPPTVWDESGRKAHWKNRPDPAQPFFAVFNLTMTHESGTFAKTRQRPQVTDPAKVLVPPYYPDTPTVRGDIARTYDNIAAMDARVGQLVTELDEADLLESTVVFFFSDHGVGLPRGKRCVYDSGTHVPLIIRHPGAEPKVTNRLVSFVDFAPTVLSIAGIEPPEWMMGHAFDGTYEDLPQPFAFFHADRMDAVLDRTRAVTDGRHRYVRNYMTDRPRIYPVAYAESIPMTSALHTLRASGAATAAQWQIVGEHKPAEEFYETAFDPHEILNLLGEEHLEGPLHPGGIGKQKQLGEIVSRLREALDAWIVETGDLGLFPEAEMVNARLWPPKGQQPQTAAPQLSLAEDGSTILACDTPGASIGWRRRGERIWRLAVLPLHLEPGGEYEAVAHRIGFGRSPVITFEVSIPR
jgi:arylsulfatase A-like enzyme